jgi:hypothetical protein
MPLLETALDRQVLRQVGAIYQFRHAALQDLLVSLAHPKPPDIHLTVVEPADAGS